MGGGNSARPGQQPYQQPNIYQQQQQGQPQFQQQGQPQYLNAQATGYPGQLQPQHTAFQNPLQQQQQSQNLSQQSQLSSQPTQQQYTQYGISQPSQPQSNPSFQQPAPLISQQTAFQPQQQQQFQQQQQPAIQQQQAPQPTGLSSSQMASSFMSSSSNQASASSSKPQGSKIPNIRLSFITASDQAKFEQLFKSATGDKQAISGDQARDILMRSKLQGESLAQVWTLADTTKSGQLLFPEFALAMYLCSLRLTGKELPATLPEKVRNEVSSMVDIISFGIPDEKPLPPIKSNAPDFFDSRTDSRSPPAIQQPQPQQSNLSILQTLNSQPTGMMPQMTGYQQGQFIQNQQTGLPIQQTGFQSQGGYQGPRPPMPPIPTGYESQIAPLSSQPTGLPGQWGFVNAPATGLPNIDALHHQMMPQAGRSGGFSSAGLSGNATIPWAVTKDEKKIYDEIFKAWDGFGKGFIGGDQAIEIFGQSGLNKSDLEKVWTLSDPNNRGKLNTDEFAVAMHLIYRKLNNYPIPARLPPELTPPCLKE